MAVRHFIGHSGARFRSSEPLPRWLEQGLRRGDYTEVRPRSSAVGGPPPKVGSGSGRAEWAAYALAQGVAGTDAMRRSEIIAAVESR